MGLFDGIKLVGDIVKGGIAAFKASEKLEELVQRSRNEFKSLIKPEQEQLYQKYATLDSAKDKEEDVEKQNAMTEKAEAAAAAYLSALAADDAFPKAFRDEITQALQEYSHANEGAIDDILGNYMMKQAKTDEEKEVVRLMLEGGKVGDKLDKLGERAQDEFKSLVKPEQAALYQSYKSLEAARDKEKKQDKKNAMTPDVEAAQEKYLSAIAADDAFPKAFRDEIASALAEYKRINDEILSHNH